MVVLIAHFQMILHSKYFNKNEVSEFPDFRNGGVGVQMCRLAPLGSDVLCFGSWVEL